MALNALSSASAAKTAAQGHVPTEAEIIQAQDMRNRDRLLQAYLNPNDTIMKNISAGENQTLNANTQQQLSNLLAANRQAQLRGRQTYFNPERQDEAISQFLTKQGDANAATSRSNALQRILQAANGYSSSANSYGGMIPNQQQAQATNNAATPALLSAGSSILGMFGGGAGGGAAGSGGSMANIFSMMANRGGNNQDLGNQMPWLQSGASS